MAICTATYIVHVLDIWMAIRAISFSELFYHLGSTYAENHSSAMSRPQYTVLQKYRHTRNFLKTRVIVKVLKNPCYPMNVDQFRRESSKKELFFWKKKKSKWPIKKNWVFQPPPKAEQSPPKFHGLVPGLVGLIDAKGSHVAQPIWLWGCLT